MQRLSFKFNRRCYGSSDQFKIEALVSMVYYPSLSRVVLIVYEEKGKLTE